jgi:hypothetical protein
MPRRSILSAAERESLLALPDAKDDLIHYTFKRNRPVGDPSAARRRQSAGLRRAALLPALSWRHPGRR